MYLTQQMFCLQIELAKRISVLISISRNRLISLITFKRGLYLVTSEQSLTNRNSPESVRTLDKITKIHPVAPYWCFGDRVPKITGLSD
jgi:hypothetical protein